MPRATKFGPWAFDAESRLLVCLRDRSRCLQRHAESWEETQFRLQAAQNLPEEFGAVLQQTQEIIDEREERARTAAARAMPRTKIGKSRRRRMLIYFREQRKLKANRPRKP